MLPLCSWRLVCRRTMEILPKNNTFFEKKSTTFKILEIFFKMLHIFSGIDFGFFELSDCLFFKSLTFLFALILFCACTKLKSILENVFYALWVYVALIQYLLTVFCLIRIKPSKKFSKLFADLKTIDSEHNFESVSLNLEIKILLACLFHILLRVLPAILLKPYNLGFLLTWMFTTVLLVQIPYSFVYYSVNNRLKWLNFTLKSATSGFTSLQNTYKSIVDLTEAYKAAFDPVFLTSILAIIPEVMVTIYYFLIHLHHDVPTVTRYLRIEYFFLLEAIIVIFAPAVCAGQLITQTYNIKCTLHEKLLEDIDPVTVLELERFIQYVGARGLQLRVYRMIPLDADLLGMVLSFCATYLIVIIQFTY